CNSACMKPMMAGPPYEVAPRWNSAVTMFFELLVLVVSIVCVVMVISRDVRVYPRTTFDILTFLSGNHAWQHDPEEASVAFVALALDATTVGFDGPAGDGQAEAGAAGRSRAGIVQAIEALEDSLVMRGGNTRSRVVHFDRAIAGRGGCDHDADLALVGCVFDRVVQQVRDTLPEDARVTLRDDRRGDGDRQFLLLIVGEHSEAVSHAPDPLAQVHDGPRQRNSTGVGPCEQQQVFHEPREPIDLLEHAADHLAIPLGREWALKGDLADAAHSGERRSQL